MDININRLWKINNNQYPLLGTSNQLTGLDFMSEYLTNHNELDRNFALNLGHMYPLWNMSEEETEGDVLTQFRADAAAVIKKHKVDLQKLWNVGQLIYNPIGNYKITESGTEGLTGSENLTKNFGAQSKTLNHGAQSESEVHGAQSKSEVHGAQSESETHGAKSKTENDAAYTDTDNIGAKSRSNESKVAPYDSDSYENDEKNDETEAARVDSTAHGAKSKTVAEQAYTDGVSKQAYTDTESKEAYTDNKSKQAYSDSESIAAKTDTEGTTSSSTKTTALSKEGNIGTTSFQQLIKDEIELWGGFNFYNTLFALICKELCYFADNGDAPILTPIQNKIFS